MKILEIIVSIIIILLAVFEVIGVVPAILLLLVFFIVIGCIEHEQKKKNLKKGQSETKGMIWYDTENRTIKLTDRHPSFKERFSFEHYESSKVVYQEEKLIYTSATVGGVTTGGVDKVVGIQSEAVKTNKFELVYEYATKDTIKKGFVEKITLTDELLKQAQKSNIAKYIKGNDILVVDELVESTDVIRGYLKIGHTASAANVMNEDKLRTMPTLDKCKAIVNWVSGEDTK